MKAALGSHIWAIKLEAGGGGGGGGGGLDSYMGHIQVAVSLFIFTVSLFLVQL